MIRNASASAAERRIRGGILSSPRPGNSISMAPMRANIRRYAAASAGRNDISIVIAAVSRSARRDPGHDPRHMGGHRIGHERQGEQHRDKDGDDLGNENQGGFLDLRERLEQRDKHADN